MKLLVIPDVHLKPDMFDMADRIMDSNTDIDGAIQMGDLVDDWRQEFNIHLYSETMQRAIKFHKDHPNTMWVMGNHDYGYHHPRVGVRESGHSKFAEIEMSNMIKDMKKAGAVQKILYRIDNCIFTHAGLNKDWLDSRLKKVGYGKHKPSKYNIDFVVNHASTAELWQENSPIWSRPHNNVCDTTTASLQVVGHTPVETPTQNNGLLSTDTFSTYRDGTPFGDMKFVVVDTESCKWEIVEDEND